MEVIEEALQVCETAMRLKCAHVHLPLHFTVQRCQALLSTAQHSAVQHKAMQNSTTQHCLVEQVE